MSDINNKTTYHDAGVNIDAGNTLVQNIKSLAHATTRPGSCSTLGGFGGLFDLAQTDFNDPLLVSTTDGVGTKLAIAQQMNNHATIGIDLVAMCVNDLLAQGAQPLFFLDYFATGKLDVNQAKQVIAGIARGCAESNCTLIGGETAEMPGMYAPGTYDLAGFAVGAVERNQVLPKVKDIKPDDVVIGLPSAGIHANGFSLVRYLLNKHNINLHDKPPFQTPYDCVGSLLLEPTKIYVKQLLPLIKNNYVKAVAHITGGGLIENIPRILPPRVSIALDTNKWETPPVFNWLAQLGNIEQPEMFRTFNMGIGMVLIVAAEYGTTIQSQVPEALAIGKVIERKNNKNNVILT